LILTLAVLAAGFAAAATLEVSQPIQMTE